MRLKESDLFHFRAKRSLRGNVIPGWGANALTRGYSISRIQRDDPPATAGGTDKSPPRRSGYCRPALPTASCRLRDPPAYAGGSDKRALAHGRATAPLARQTGMSVLLARDHVLNAAIAQ